MTRRHTIGDMLLEAHLVDEAQLVIALGEQRRNGRKLGSTLVELGLVDENVLAAFLSKQIDVPCVSLLNVEIPLAALRRIPPVTAHKLGVVPIRVEGNSLQVAMIDPTDIDQITELEEATGLRIDPLVAPESSVRRVAAKNYPLGEDGVPVGPDDGVTGVRILFPDLVEEFGAGSDRIVARLEAMEREIRSLRTLLDELVQLIRDSKAG